jgi:hypothetical protein
MDQPELMQTAGRLCVSTPRGDNVPLTLYATKEVEKDLVKAYWLQEELIERANKEYQVSHNPLWKLIQDMPIYKRKIPTKKRSLTKKVDYELNEISKKDDGGYDFGDYKFENEIESDEESKVDRVRSLDYVEETKRRIKNALKNGQTYISIFLNQVDINASYTTDELLELLERSGFQQPRSYMISLTRISNYGFRRIFDEAEDSKWKIFDDLKSSWL